MKLLKIVSEKVYNSILNTEINLFQVFSALFKVSL